MLFTQCSIPSCHNEEDQRTHLNMRQHTESIELQLSKEQPVSDMEISVNLPCSTS